MIEVTTAAPTAKVAYSIGEVVQVTPFGRSTIYEEIKRGRLKTYKKGARRYITHEHLIEWLTSDLEDPLPSPSDSRPMEA